MPLLLHFFFGVDYCFTFGRLNNRIGEGTHEACPYYTFRGVGGLFREVDAYPGCTQYQQRALSHDEAVNMAAMGNLQPVRLHCDLSDFEHCEAIECGVYRYHPRETTTVHLHQCTKNTKKPSVEVLQPLM